jgi:hypothetical protein
MRFFLSFKFGTGPGSGIGSGRTQILGSFEENKVSGSGSGISSGYGSGSRIGSDSGSNYYFVSYNRDLV